MSAVGGAPQRPRRARPRRPRSSSSRGRRCAPPRSGSLIRGALGANAALVVGLDHPRPLIVVGLLAPLIAPHDPVKQDIDNIARRAGLRRPPARHRPARPRHALAPPLRDPQRRPRSPSAAVILPFVIGTVVGIVAGYRGGWVDSVLVGIVDVIIAFPILVLLIALVFVARAGGEDDLHRRRRDRLGRLRPTGANVGTSRSGDGVRDGRPGRRHPDLADPRSATSSRT